VVEVAECLLCNPSYFFATQRSCGIERLDALSDRFVSDHFRRGQAVPESPGIEAAYITANMSVLTEDGMVMSMIEHTASESEATNESGLHWLLV
jgi:hypothetical protein